MTIEQFKSYLKKKYPHRSSFLIGLSMLITDIIVLMICIGLGFFIVNIFCKENINFKSFINYVVFVPGILLVFAATRLYPGIMLPPADQVKKYSIGTFFSFAGIIMSILLTDLNNIKIINKFITKDSQDIQICFAFLIAFIFATILLPAMRELSKRIYSKFSWWGVPAVIYSTDKSAIPVVDKLLENKYLGYIPCAIIESSKNIKNTEYKNIPIFSCDNLEVMKEIHDYNIKPAFLCDYKGKIDKIMTLYRYTITVSKEQKSFTCTQQIKDIAGIIGVTSTHNLTFKTNMVFKRLIDIFLILFFSPIWLPIFILIAILVKLTSRGPIFYGHKRVGKNGKTIKCWKFRSMNIKSDEMLEKILKTDPVRRAEWEKDRKFVDDPRVTKFGKILRKTSLDELPQLFNILLGQMSFVGPRPVTESELEKYGHYKNYILSVLPGLSGMWQISGRSDTSYEERIAFDTFYIQNWSIWLDIWILIKTVWIVLSRKGAY